MHMDISERSDISVPPERTDVYADLGGGLNTLANAGSFSTLEAPANLPSIPIQPQPEGVYVPLSAEQIALNKRGLIDARAALAASRGIPEAAAAVEPRPEQLILPLVPKRG